MKTLAFLQNMWVNDPDRVKAMIERSEHAERLRRMLIARALFAGCVTGRRIRAELGDLCESIVWEEASREILGDPKTVPVADVDHMMKAMALEKPALVVTFGKVAEQAYAGIRQWFKPEPVWIFSPHPAARNPACRVIFKEAMRRVRELQ